MGRRACAVLGAQDERVALKNFVGGTILPGEQFGGVGTMTRKPRVDNGGGHEHSAVNDDLFADFGAR